MHPEILRQVAGAQINDQRARAQRGRVARTLAKAQRSGHYGTNEADGFVAPRVPDYVDGSFRADDIQIEVPAARTAA